MINYISTLTLEMVWKEPCFLSARGSIRNSIRLPGLPRGPPLSILMHEHYDGSVLEFADCPRVSALQSGSQVSSLLWELPRNSCRLVTTWDCPRELAFQLFCCIALKSTSTVIASHALALGLKNIQCTDVCKIVTNKTRIFASVQYIW